MLHGSLLCLCWFKPTINQEILTFCLCSFLSLNENDNPLMNAITSLDLVHLAFVNRNTKLVKYLGRIRSVLLLKLVPTRGHGRVSKAAIFSAFV